MLSILNNDRRGVVLIVMLAVLALMCLIGITLVTTTRIEIKAATSFAAGARARLVCDSALQIVLRDFTDDATMWDKYGDEGWYHYAQDDRGNLCFGGTVESISGRSLVDLSDKFEPTFSGDDHARYEYLSGLILQPNVNKDQTVLIWRCNGTTLTTSSDLTGIAYPGDEYRVLGGYKLSQRNHSSVWPAGQESTNDSDSDGIFDAQDGETCAYFTWSVWTALADPDLGGTYGPKLGTAMVIFDEDEFGGGYSGRFYSGGGTPPSAVTPIICREGYYTTDERSDGDPGNSIFQVPAGQVWVFNISSTWMWVDQEVDLSGDGTDESKWINFDLYDGRYSSRYTAHVRDDTAGRLNVNMAGNLAIGGDDHYENMGFDPSELNLVRFIQGVAAEGAASEITSTASEAYAKRIIQGRVGGTDTDGYGLTSDVPSHTGSYSSKSADSKTVTVTWTTAPADSAGNVIFLGRSNWLMNVGGTGGYRIVDNTAETITADAAVSETTGAITIIRGTRCFDPADSTSHGSWSPFDELDEMEIRTNSPYGSRLERYVVDVGHDGVDNNGNSANTDITASDTFTDYHELRWGYDPNDSGDYPGTAKANAGRDEDGRYMDGTGTTVMDELDDDGDGTADEVGEEYCLHEEWDMIRHHLTTRFPSAVSLKQRYQPIASPPPRANLNTSSKTDIDTALTNAGLEADIVDQLVANILAWRDSDDEVDRYLPDHYGVERQPFINEIYWEDIAADGIPTTDDYYGVELFNPFNEAISFANDRWKIIAYNTASSVEVDIILTNTNSIGPGGYYTIGKDNTKPAGGYTQGDEADFNLCKTGAVWGEVRLYHEAPVGNKWVLVDEARLSVAATGVDSFNEIITGVAGTSAQRPDPIADHWALKAGHTLSAVNDGLLTTGRYDVTIQNRAFATLGEIVQLIGPQFVNSGADPINLVYTDDAADRRDNITGTSDDDDGDGVNNESDEGDIHFKLSFLYDNVDNDGANGADDSAEADLHIFNYITVHDTNVNDSRWHGMINVNTASRAMLMALPPMGAFPDKGRRLAEAIIRGRAPDGYESLLDLFAILNKSTPAPKYDIPRASNDGYDNDGDGSIDEADEGEGDVDYLDSDGVDNDLDGLTDEIGEGIEYFYTRVGNLLTFRSEIFDVIVRSSVWDRHSGKTVAESQLRAVVDRSSIDPTAETGPRVLSKRWE